MMKRLKFSDPLVGRGPTKVEVKHHVASGHAQHRTWCDACLGARGIAGRHERRVSGREDEDPLVAIDYGYLNLDGTEDDDDDDDETTQNKLLILVANDAKNWNVCSNLSSRKIGE